MSATAYLQERARRAIALAEACSDPADKAAYMAAAKAWEQLATGARVEWSNKPARQALESLKRDVADATGPFARQAAPTPPPAPIAAPAAPQEVKRRVRESVSIEF